MLNVKTFLSRNANFIYVISENLVILSNENLCIIRHLRFKQSLPLRITIVTAAVKELIIL